MWQACLTIQPIAEICRSFLGTLVEEYWGFLRTSKPSLSKRLSATGASSDLKVLHIVGQNVWPAEVRTEYWFSFNRRHALGPKDRKLVAGPALRGGRGIPSSDSPKGPQRIEAPAQTFAHLRCSGN